MQNKKLYITLAVAILIVAVSAFIGGRLLNGSVNPVSLFSPGSGGNAMSIQINMTPAPELPITEPDARGVFVERNDNTITLQTFSMDSGGGGVVISEAPSSGGQGGQIVSQSVEQGPQVEVLITNETVIYRDATEMPPLSNSNEPTVLQQEVIEGSLDELNANSMIMVWGRKNGDRIIADVILYTQPMVMQKNAP